eukprot:5349786-Amphidinium_carterae.1
MAEPRALRCLLTVLAWAPECWCTWQLHLKEGHSIRLLGHSVLEVDLEVLSQVEVSTRVWTTTIPPHPKSFPHLRVWCQDDCEDVVSRLSMQIVQPFSQLLLLQSVS